MTIHPCAHAGCVNDTAYGTPECLEHAEVVGAARPVLLSPFTTEPPAALSGMLTDAEFKAVGDALIAMVPPMLGRGVTLDTSTPIVPVAEMATEVATPSELPVSPTLGVGNYPIGQPSAPGFDEMRANLQAAVERVDATGLPPRIKLTAEQIAAIPRYTDEQLPWHPGDMMLGVPVDLVDTVEESTPYLMAALEVPRPIELQPTDMTPAEVTTFKAAFEWANRGGEKPRFESGPPYTHIYRLSNNYPDDPDDPATPVYDPDTGEYLGSVISPTYTVAVKSPLDAVVTFEPVPTVGFHEPPQPGWLRRLLDKWFG